MACCSAYDVSQARSPLVPGEEMAAIEAAERPVKKCNDNHRCYNEVNNSKLGACPGNKCRRDINGDVADEHEKERCPHDTRAAAEARPWGVDAAAVPDPAQPEQRQE